MQRILMHPDPTGHQAWEASNPQNRERAFLALFRYLDGQNRYSGMDSVESQLYGMARNGNGKAAEALLLLRRDKVGEAFFEVQVTPTAPPPLPRRTVKVPVPETIDFDIDVDPRGTA